MQLFVNGEQAFVTAGQGSAVARRVLIMTGTDPVRAETAQLISCHRHLTVMGRLVRAIWRGMVWVPVARTSRAMTMARCRDAQQSHGIRLRPREPAILAAILLCLALAGVPSVAHADYVSNARDSLKNGDLKSAQIDLRNAVRSDPQNAEAHYLLGRVSFELGDAVAAEREAEAARDRGYDPHQAVPLLTQSMLAQGKYQNLLDELKPDGKDATIDADILVARGYALIGLKKPDDAQKSFAEAQRAAPNAVEPLLADARLSVARADLNGAEAKIDQAIAVQPKSVQALLAKAQLLRLKNDGPGAMAVLDDLIATQPDAMQAHLDRASLALAMAKNDLARADIEAVLKGTPGNVQAIYLAAVMEAQAGHFSVADKYLERIAGYIPRLQRAFYLQAVVKEQLGQYEQAEDSARK